MDDLLQHCIQELAFDGDLGCDTARLRQFIHGFYNSHQSNLTQNVDDAFCAFIWGLLAEQPAVLVGLVPPGSSVEVYIAPQPSKHKDKSRRNKDTERDDEQSNTNRLAPLSDVDIQDYASLINQYGSDLRVAVNPDACLHAITGGHVRPAKLSAMVYTVLQFISRSREVGLTVVDLGKKTGYDQKACFYLVKQLISLDLIVKLPQRGAGGGGNLCIHKRFYEKSKYWQKIRQEESAEVQDDFDAKIASVNAASFDALDTRHLANRNFVKSRIVSLLSKVEHGLHPYSNLILALGFSRPSKQDRRNFSRQVQGLINEGFIEKVLAPRSQGSSKCVLCIRLVQATSTSEVTGTVLQAPGGAEFEEQEEQDTKEKDKEADMTITSPLTNVTIHRQLVKLLEEAGHSGLTLHDISMRLGMFDKRTLEHLLFRLERYFPPSHLVDLAVCDSIENAGRIRRHRYYTLSGYLDFIQQENIDNPDINVRYTSTNRTQVGKFFDDPTLNFYKNEAELARYEDTYRDTVYPPKEGKTRTVGRPRKVHTKAIGQKEKKEGTKRKRKDMKGDTKEVLNKRKRRKLEVDSPDSTNQQSSAANITFEIRGSIVESMEANELPGNVSSFDPEVSSSMPTACSVSLTTMEKEQYPTVDVQAPQRLKRSVIVDELGDSDERMKKRPRSGRPKRSNELVNISQLRAENEIMRVVAGCGGIVNTSSKDFWEAYEKVLASLNAANQPTSLPMGSQPDKRTLWKILDRLIERGKLKTTTATVVPRLVQPRIAKVIYEPTLSQEQLDSFLASLAEDKHAYTHSVSKRVEAPVSLTPSAPVRNRKSEKPHNTFVDPTERDAWCRDIVSLGDNDEYMRSKFLSEAQTVAQLYGYLLGKARRVKELHLFTVSHLHAKMPSANVVSHSQRVVSLQYFFEDLPVSTYFSVVSNMAYDAELSDIMTTDEGRMMPIKDLPPQLYEQLQIGKGRARSRIIDLLQILAYLNLVVPLRPSDSATTDFTCESKDTFPTHFDRAPIPEVKSTSYWKFNEVAPIYILSQTRYWPPPFHRDMIVRTADQCLDFWKELEWASMNDESELPVGSSDSITGPCVCDPRIAKGLRRTQAWVSSYELSWAQKQYLTQKWTNPATAYTPLLEPDGGSSVLQRICNVIYAPFAVVYDFFLNMHETFKRLVDRMHRAQEQKRKDDAAIGAARDKAFLAQKAAKTREQVGAEWDTLVSKVYPHPLPYGSVGKLKTLRTRYIESRAAMSIQQWEETIREILQTTKSGKKNPTLPFIPRKRNFPSGMAQLEPVISEKEKSVEELIEEVKNKCSFSSQSGVAAEDNRRRQRFNWTPEFDELVKDASVIIKARCRNSRIDWGAFDQLFPTLPRNTVRQRLGSVRSEGAVDAYLRALEDKWHELWLQYCGTAVLPDDHPTHPSDFDIITHVEFLRSYIDKQALRVGVSISASNVNKELVLSEDVLEFLSQWNVESPKTNDRTEIIWSTAGDEHREKSFLSSVFSVPKLEAGSIATTDSRYLIGVAESALKMVLHTHDEDYDSTKAASLLDIFGNATIRKASENLQERNVIFEVRDIHKKRPGRKLRVVDANEDALGGIFHEEVFLDACANENYIDQDPDEWKEWNLLATNGDMASLVEQVSERSLNFKMDLSEHIRHRQELDWNSKKVDDDQIEIGLKTQTAQKPSFSGFEGSMTSPIPIPMELDETEEAEGHGFNDGKPVTCKKDANSKGVVTCFACIKTMTTCLKGSRADKRTSFEKIRTALIAAGPNGILYSAECLTSQVLPVLHELTASPQPLAFWLGYSHPTLVAREHVRSWLVGIPDNHPHLLFPRRWLNIKGERIDRIWNAGLRAIIALILMRPGISQHDIRVKFHNIYDRQEINDFLSILADEQIIIRQTDLDHGHLLERSIRSTGPGEEMHIHLTLNQYPWYRVIQA